MFYDLEPNTLIFFAKKMREGFALQKLLTFFFNKKNIGVFQILMFEKLLVLNNRAQVCRKYFFST